LRITLSLLSYDVSPASIHRNKAPSRASPDLTPACAPIIVPTSAPAPTLATPSGVVPTSAPAPTRVTPSGGVSKTDTNANTGSRYSWTTPTPTAAAPSHSRTTSAPAGTVPSTSSDPAVEAGAMKAAAAEPRPRRGVGRNQRRTQSYDHQCNRCFPEHGNLAIELKQTPTELVGISLVPAQDYHFIGIQGYSARRMTRWCCKAARASDSSRQCATHQILRTAPCHLRARVSGPGSKQSDRADQLRWWTF
jgi:hypothetical protein